MVNTEFLKEWTLCVCVALICAVILSLFSPQGRMNRFYKMLIALFVFASFVYPLRDFKKPDYDRSGIQTLTAVEEENNSLYEKMVDRQVNGILSENGITGASVSCRADYNIESGEITLNGVDVAVPDNYNTAEVESLLLNTLGIHARVIHVGD